MTRWGTSVVWGTYNIAVYGFLVGFLYDKMGTYNIALYGSGRFLV